MPETALGLFPDIGASYFLSRLPGFFGNDSYIVDLHILNVKYSHVIDSFCLFHKILNEVGILLGRGREWGDYIIAFGCSIITCF